MKLGVFVLLFIAVLLRASAENCGKQAGGRVCANNECCSRFGWCGTTDDHCTAGCQSQCRPAGGGGGSTPSPTPSGGAGDVASLIPQGVFDSMLKYRNDPRCVGHGFYTYNGFITAARATRGFGTTGDVATRKREIAAFLAQTSHETTGGWASAPDGPYAWGYCFVKERGNPPTYCSSPSFPCAPGKAYYGRGPIQLTHNYNYAQAGKAIGVDLINNPDLVSSDPAISFRTALWFWMTPQSNKPSSHNVITGRWQPSGADRAANRNPGYGVITNIINGGLECGHGADNRVADRIGFYRRYCQILGADPGPNLDCGNQRSFG